MHYTRSMRSMNFVTANVRKTPGKKKGGSKRAALAKAERKANKYGNNSYYGY